jgi:hypothetical protein
MIRNKSRLSPGCRAHFGPDPEPSEAAAAPVGKPASIKPATARKPVSAKKPRKPAKPESSISTASVRSSTGTIDPRTVRLVTHKDVDDDAIAGTVLALDEISGGSDA